MFSREKMIDEMLTQIRGVFQHYADQKLSEADLSEVRNALNEAIPAQYTSDSWAAYAAQYDAEKEKQ